MTLSEKRATRCVGVFVIEAKVSSQLIISQFMLALGQTEMQKCKIMILVFTFSLFL